ncbi:MULTISPECIES: ABC transporter substrate-binding protein [Petrotoga]|uniref:Carbohydrate ABC transporter substrate-binding protein (CUT1 family) n=2 Tax=Petrotoga sibirica TaxID=156202 RepID=A0A4R8EEB0_9BACT|nr:MULTISPECIES: sugar ABC transporter substrate-binding protein [Petrotoga]KUK83686.1 MAG: Extracellular solute-binding protein family 1 [Petrotoga mobilis]POZ89004.1 ABC transporter substrate-binding protein [Petrotoga sibirica DSM 13575]POZ91413.1 ABC transporter substrate-binding protein [Petrotoga sp. SL27]TDX10110.1 carbohydrate ABC transporter substrate-binding protein (CUT1 family) [Petrotoga sibirica]
MKKFFVVLSCLIIGSLVLSAERVTVEFWTLSLSTFSDYVNSVIDTFEAANPDIKINWVDIPYNAFQQKLIASIASGNVPDLVNMNTPWVIDFAAQNALSPIDEFVPVADKYVYLPNYWEATVIDGKSFAIPWYISPRILLYNRQIFEEAGLDPNVPPKTWDEIIEYSRIIKEKTGLYGYQPNIVAHLDLQEEGVPLISADGKKPIVNTPEAIARLKQHQLAFKEALMPQDLGGYQAAKQKFAGGKIAMFPVGITMVKHVQINSPSIFEVSDVTSYPLGKGKRIPASAMNVAVPSKAKNKAEAVKFGLWLTSPYWQVEFAKIATIVPSTKISLDEDPWFLERAKRDLNVKAQLLASKSMIYGFDLDAIGKIIEPSKYSEFRRILNDYWIAAIKGDYTAEEALYLAEEELKEVLSSEF